MSPLEALLGHVPVLPVVHLAQSVGVAASVLSPGAPVNLQYSTLYLVHYSVV